ncbi:protein bric-a-brac 2-like isoform X2 [Dinothrombium tinctorium]|uniref:Protein bric-a-brac 2-like isoform X2 n=1 Tax=Dinothrombium tinctorium TaxID=1965070 RepID=A0A3S4QD39_9ACAR|nr:protein bric-a-brac 2-like isoform X2 [Dinothrombium tinctorium]
MTNVSQSAAFCIKLNSHPSDLIQAFHQLYLDESLVDVTISCGGGNLKAHKVVLSASSNYFKSIFMSFTTPCQYPVVIIKDIHFHDLKAIVEFMYCGEITVPQSSLQSLLNAARMLQVKGLSDIQISSTGAPVSKFNGCKQQDTAPSFGQPVVPNAARRKRYKRKMKKKSGEEESSLSDGEAKAGKFRRESDENSEETYSSTECEDDFRSIEAKKESNKLTPVTEPTSSATITLKDISKPLTSSNDSNSHLPMVPIHQNLQPALPPNKPILIPGFSAPFENSNQLSTKCQLPPTRGLLGCLSAGRKQWGDDESKALVDSWHAEYTRCKIGGESTLSYKSVCEQLRLQGIDCTPNQVREKVRALKNNYNSIKLGTAKQLVRNHMMPFMEKLQVVLEDNASTDF